MGDRRSAAAAAELKRFQRRGNRDHRLRQHDQRGTLPHARLAEALGTTLSTSSRATARATNPPQRGPQPEYRRREAPGRDRRRARLAARPDRRRRAAIRRDQGARSSSARMRPNAASARRSRNCAAASSPSNLLPNATTKLRAPSCSRRRLRREARLDDQHQRPPPAPQPRHPAARRRARRLGNPPRPDPGVSGANGIYMIEDVFKQMADAMPAFAGLSLSKIGDLGVQLNSRPRRDRRRRTLCHALRPSDDGLHSLDRLDLDRHLAAEDAGGSSSASCCRWSPTPSMPSAASAP